MFKTYDTPPDKEKCDVRKEINVERTEEGKRVEMKDGKKAGNSLPSKLHSSNLLDNLSIGVYRRLELVGPLESVHDPVGQLRGVLGHHAIGDVVEMEEVVHEVVHDTKALGRAVVIAVGGELTGLEAVHGGDFFGGEVGDEGEHPREGCGSFLVACRVVGKRKVTMRDEIWEHEGGGWRERWSGGGGAGVRGRVEL